VKMRVLYLLSLTLVAGSLGAPSASGDGESPVPIVMWHGMGDTCCNPLSLGRIQKVIEKEIGEGSYVHSLKFKCPVAPLDIDGDQLSGFLTPCNQQVEDACKMIQEDEKLKDGYNALGFSQGGQFLRAVAQRCPNPPMKNLITFGGQHQGVYGLPKCDAIPFLGWLCNLGREGVNEIIYDDILQNNLVQAQYWHDPLDQDKYVKYSQFIAEINGEGINPNATYVENLMKLEKMVLVMFSGDTMVHPRESSHFKFYKTGQAEEIVDFDDDSVTMGLKDALVQMKTNGQIDYLESPGDHLQFSETWLKEKIIDVYLK